MELTNWIFNNDVVNNVLTKIERKKVKRKASSIEDTELAQRYLRRYHKIKIEKSCIYKRTQK